MCLKPIFAPSAICFQGDVHAVCFLHFFNDNFFYALFFYRARITGLRILLAKLTVNVGVNIALGALWSSMLYGKGYYYYLVKSTIKNIGLLPVETILLFLFFKAALPAAIHGGLLPEQKGVRLW